MPPIRFPAVVLGLVTLALILVTSFPGVAQPTPAQLLQQGSQAYQAGQVEAAISSWQQAQQLYQQQGDRQGAGTALKNLGVAYLVLERYRPAIAALEQVVPLVKEAADRRGEAQTLSNLGIAYKETGNYARAIALHKQAGMILYQLGDRAALGQALLNLGNVFEAVGDYDRARSAYDQSLKLAQQTKDRVGQGVALGNLAAIDAALGDYPQAITTFQKSLEISQAVGDRASQASILINLGSAYFAQGKPELALQPYRQSLTLARQIQNRQLQARALSSLGLAYDQAQDYRQAMQHYRQGLAIAEQLGDPNLEGMTLNNFGETLRKAGQLEAAETYLRRAVKLLDALRPGLSDTYKVSIFDTQLHTYNLLQQVLIVANQPEAALEVSEQGRSRAFAELLSRRLQNQAGAAEKQVASADRPIDLATIRQIARQQQATLVEYAIVVDDDFRFRGKRQGREQALYIWVVSPTGKVSFRQVDLRSLWAQQLTLTDLVRASRCFSPTCKPLGQTPGRGLGVVGNSSPKPSSRPVSQVALEKLHQLLIQPIGELLPANPSDRVIFIPQGPLFLVPFPALRAGNGQYLVEQHTPLTAPAIQVLGLTHQQSQQRQGSGREGPLIVGNPTMPEVAPAPDEEPFQLSPLPGAEQEARAIARLLQTPVLVGDQATKAAVLQRLPRANWIHLATHGLLEYGNTSLNSLEVPGAIALAPSPPDSGLLTASEILDLRLQADLVVLSACDTGQGRITGDGVIGLSRSFIVAGASSVIVSLWMVPDAPTAQLMTQFYQSLQTNSNKAAALRSAMLTTMKQYPEPYAWAAFTLIGEAY